MNRDPENIQKQILALLQDLLPNASITDAEAIGRALGGDSVNQPVLFETLSPLTPQDMNSNSSGLPGSASASPKDALFQLGDVPAVQDRYYALLKNRLQSEIEQNPPLFPWETEQYRYETGWVWSRQLKKIQLPVQVPADLLAKLLERCQDLAQSSLKEGAKLVQAVEELFPNQPDALNHLAGLVMTSPARSGVTATPVGANFPSSYEAAAPTQKMVLSLLAAREILTSLSLTLSSHSPVTERQWESHFGPVRLKAIYDTQSLPSSLRLQVTVPCEGKLSLLDEELHLVAQRFNAGYLSVELVKPQVDQAYSLTLVLSEQVESPLTFVVRVQPD
jgi:hypothetical protein